MNGAHFQTGFEALGSFSSAGTHFFTLSMLSCSLFYPCPTHQVASLFVFGPRKRQPANPSGVFRGLGDIALHAINITLVSHPHGVSFPLVPPSQISFPFLHVPWSLTIQPFLQGRNHSDLFPPTFGTGLTWLQNMHFHCLLFLGAFLPSSDTSCLFVLGVLMMSPRCALNMDVAATSFG